MLRLYFVIYQITVTQPFLAALCIFLKGNSEQNSNKAMCPCKYNEDFFSLVPNLPSLSGEHQGFFHILFNGIPTITEKTLSKQSLPPEKGFGHYIFSLQFKCL